MAQPENKPQAVISMKDYLSFCHNCGEKGSHLVPPSMGDPSFYICDPNPELVEQKMRALQKESNDNSVSET